MISVMGTVDAIRILRISDFTFAVLVDVQAYAINVFDRRNERTKEMTKNGKDNLTFRRMHTASLKCRYVFM